MKKNGVLVTLLVNDYDRALDFYVNTLELFQVIADTRLSESCRYVCIALKDYVEEFMIHLMLPTTTRDTAAIGSQAGDEVLFTFPVKDIEMTHVNLMQKSIKIEPCIEWMPYGGGTVVSDPFGNKICLFEHFISRFD